MAKSNVEKLDNNWTQLNNKKSWLFTHIADTILDTPIPVRNGTKDQKTSLRTELAWNSDNFRTNRTNAAATNAALQSMAGALAAVSKGESFDEAKLLAGIDKTVRAAMADTVKVDISVEGGK